nr:patatin-like phospholipase family protein [Saprospiraceae bacterium]
MEKIFSFPFKNLVFEGGGVLGVAYQGFYEVLEKYKIAPQIRRVCGTSAGTISATMIALGYNASECKEILLDSPFNTFCDGGWLGPYRLLKKFGWYKGDKMKDFFKEVIKNKTGDPNITFKEVEQAGYMDLRLVATNATKNISVIFSHEKTPNLNVAEGMRASSSIPYFFAAQKINSDIYIDGGILRNYAIQEFDDLSPDETTLGAYVMDPLKPPLPIKGFFSYTGHFMAAMKRQQYIQLINEKHDFDRTVFIDDLGISPVDFKITRDQKLALMEQGRLAAERYIKNRFSEMD